MSLQEELTAMIEAEEKRLGVNSPEFLQRHQEIMDQIDGLMTGSSTAAVKSEDKKDNAELLSDYTALVMWLQEEYLRRPEDFAKEHSLEARTAKIKHEILKRMKGGEHIESVTGDSRESGHDD